MNRHARDIVTIRHARRRLRILSLLALALALQPGVAAVAQSDQRCFPETGFCIAGPIRVYWERNGGLPIFGYPLGAQHEELVEGRSIQVQWFERDRLEIQADGTLTADRLGARFLQLTGRPWVMGERGAIPRCRFFPQTSYSICGAVRAYWEGNGGVERFGYPLTDLITERIEGRDYQVQFFERRRLELHSDLGGTPFAIQLGLLGREIATAAVCPQAVTDLLRAAVRRYLDVMGCPLDQGHNGATAWQRYERGAMYWVTASPSAPPMIFVIVNDDAAQRSTWQAHTDTYREGEPVGGDVPSGRISPQRGFGKLWWSDIAIRNALGWPVEPEQGGSGAAVAFTSGGWMLQRPLPDEVIVMKPDGMAFAVRRDLLSH